MSTKAIRKVLEELKERLQDALDAPEFSRDQTELDRRRLKDTDAALAELEAIEKAAKSIVDNGGADLLRAGEYDVSVDLLESIAKEAP